MEETEDESARLFAFQSLLDGSRHALEKTVDLPALRGLCARGIPDHPPHLRPLAYSLLLECLPTEKQTWKSTERQQRQRYYSLVQTFMEELDSWPPAESSTPTAFDILLLNINKDVQRIALRSSFWRGRTRRTRTSPLSPPSRDFDPRRSTSPAEQDDSSSDDEAQATPRKAADPLLSRRALFTRLDSLAEAEHRRAAIKTLNSNISSTYNGTDPNFGGQNSSTSSTDPPSPDSGTILSPKITLSVEPATLPSSTGMLSRLDAKRPTPISTTEISNGSLATPDHNLVKPPSPITLLSPKPIPKSGSSHSSFPASSSLSGSLYQSDTHSESLTRLLYVFYRANPHVTLDPAFADIASTLYVIFAGVTPSDRLTDKKRSNTHVAQLGHIEERTFWNFSAIVSEMGELWEKSDLVTGPSNIYQKLERRLYWADNELYNVLKSNDLDPSGPLYTHRWLSHLFTSDFSPGTVPGLWDFILSERATTPDAQPKVDAVVDIAVSMLLLVKDILLHRRSGPRQLGDSPRSASSGLWGDVEVSKQTTSGPEGADADHILIHGLKLLRAYPLKTVGGIERLLQTALEVRQARTDALASGNDPDKFSPPTKETSTSGYLSKISSLVASGEKTLADVSSTWATSAASKVAEVTHGVTGGSKSREASDSSWGSFGKSAGKLWQTAWGGAYADEDNHKADHQTYESALPSTPPRDPSGLNGVKRFPATLSRRERSDSAASSVSSIHERIASLTSPFSGQRTPSNSGHTKSTSLQSPGPRPLLLSGSARKTSAAGPPRRGSLPTRSPAGESPTSVSTLSPPATGTRSTLVDTPTNGLYRIGSRQSQMVRSNSALSDSPSVGRNLDYGQE